MQDCAVGVGVFAREWANLIVYITIYRSRSSAKFNNHHNFTFFIRLINIESSHKTKYHHANKMHVMLKLQCKLGSAMTDMPT